MGVNIDRLRSELEFVAQNRHLWDQEEWIHRSECGTYACLAGWTVLHEPGIQIPADQQGCWIQERRTSVGTLAMDILGLNEEDAAELFHATNTIEDLWRIASDITDGAIQAPVSVGGAA